MTMFSLDFRQILGEIAHIKKLKWDDLPLKEAKDW
jgi:hypothetical protein